jgi:hypothetical protein
MQDGGKYVECGWMWSIDWLIDLFTFADPQRVQVVPWDMEFVIYNTVNTAIGTVIEYCQLNIHEANNYT